MIPTTSTIISNYIPLQDPAGGPNFYNFGNDVLYEMHVDNDGDAVADHVYEFRFTTTLTNPETFLYATGPIEILDDPDWNIRQTYTVSQVVDGVRTVLGQNLPVPPNNIGAARPPTTPALADAAINDLPGGIKAFAGQREDPFWVDLGSIFDLGALRPFNSLHLIPDVDGPGVDASRARTSTRSRSRCRPRIWSPTPDFFDDDDDGNPHEQAIDAIAKAGITDRHRQPRAPRRQPTSPAASSPGSRQRRRPAGERHERLRRRRRRASSKPTSTPSPPRASCRAAPPAATARPTR